MADQLNLDLDPRKVIESLKQMSAETAKLSEQIEESLGRKAKGAVDDLEDAAEKGSNNIGKFFSNLGKRVKDDLKSAFDVGSVLAGASFAKELGSGVKQVFEMERAFDRLNTRIGLSGRELSKFKTELGSAVAGTGAKLQDVLPGVESAAARGGIKDPKQLSAIGEALGRVRMTTGEDTTALSDSVIEIMKNQGLAMNSGNYNSTVDAIQGTRANGAFKNAGEAANKIEALSPYGRTLGLDVRQLGGLAAQASQGGQGSEDILRQILEQGSTIQGRAVLNATLGQKIFNKGKLDPAALAKIDPKRFGNDQILGEASGLSGANGQDLNRFISAFKQGDGMDKVTSGANETAKQYQMATDNLASAVDRFKEKSKEAGREVAGGLSELAYGIMSGNGAKAAQGAKDTGSAIWNNKGTIAADVAMTAGVGILAGGGARRLLGKLGGGALGGAVGNAIGGEAAKAAGIQQVYVVNMPDGGLAGAAGGLMGGKAGGIMGKLGAAGAVVSAGAIGYEVGKFLMDNNVLGIADGSGKATDYLAGKMGDISAMETEGRQVWKNRNDFNQRNGTNLSVEQYAKAVEDGTLKALKANAARPPTMTNPSAVTGRAVGG